MRHVQTCSALLLTMLTLAAPAAAQTARAASSGKPGGVLKPVLREDLPQGFAIHESATNSVTWPAMPCYSNLVIFDQQKQLERTDTIVPELAERWSWQDNLPTVKNLVPHSVVYNCCRLQDTWLDK